MPLSISISELGVALRIAPTTGGVRETQHLEELTRLHRVAEFTIDEYAPEAPQDIQDEAAVLMAGYIFEAPPHNRGPQNAFYMSGAQSLLSRWHPLQSALVGVTDDDEDEEEVIPLRYVGRSMNEVIDSSDLDAGTSFAVTTNSVDTPDAVGEQYVWAASPVGNVPSSIQILFGGSPIGALTRIDDLVYNGLSLAIFRSTNALNLVGLETTLRFNP